MYLPCRQQTRPEPADPDNGICCAGLFKIARQMYLLFQQQTTLERAASDNDMWGPFSEEQPSCLKAFSLLRMFGPTTCLVAPDSRAGVPDHSSSACIAP